jgi:hypothetical protein
VAEGGDDLPPRHVGPLLLDRLEDPQDDQDREPEADGAVEPRLAEVPRAAEAAVVLGVDHEDLLVVPRVRPRDRQPGGGRLLEQDVPPAAGREQVEPLLAEPRPHVSPRLGHPAEHEVQHPQRQPRHEPRHERRDGAQPNHLHRRDRVLVDQPAEPTDEHPDDDPGRQQREERRQRDERAGLELERAAAHDAGGQLPLAREGDQREPDEEQRDPAGARDDDPDREGAEHQHPPDHVLEDDPEVPGEEVAGPLREPAPRARRLATRVGTRGGGGGLSDVTGHALPYDRGRGLYRRSDSIVAARL